MHSLIGTTSRAASISRLIVSGLPTSSFGTCADHELGDVGAYLGENNTTASVPASNDYVPGCSPGAAVVAKAESCESETPDADCAAPQNVVSGGIGKGKLDHRALQLDGELVPGRIQP